MKKQGEPFILVILTSSNLHGRYGGDDGTIENLYLIKEV